MTRGVSFVAMLANRVGFKHHTQGTPLLLSRHHPQLWVIAHSLRVTQVRNPANKLLLGEINSLTIFDGMWDPDHHGCSSPENKLVNHYPSARHDNKVPEEAHNSLGWPLGSCNVIFVDGHYMFFERWKAHDLFYKSYNPKLWMVTGQ